MRYNKNNCIQCAVQRGSLYKMCGTTWILIENMRYNGDPYKKCAVQLESEPALPNKLLNPSIPKAEEGNVFIGDFLEDKMFTFCKNICMS